MAKKRKVKKKKPQNESYEIQVEDWEVDYHFGLNTAPKDLIQGVYWEWSKLILTGKILSPTIKTASKTRIELADEPVLDDHWKPTPTVASAQAVGWMEIPRGDDTLIFYCSIPSRSFEYISLSVSSGKIKYASIFGTKLKWRKGRVSSISLSTIREEE